MSAFDMMPIVAGLIGAAVYFAIVFFAGLKGWWWLAVLVTLPAAMGGLLYIFTPVDVPADAPFVFRHFGLAVVAQILFGLLVYVAGRTVGRRQDHEKDATN